MQKWNDADNEDNVLWLVTIPEYDQLPDGIKLECINGMSVKTKGIDNIDMDTRYGHIAFGVRGPFREGYEHRNLFLTFILKQ